MLTVCVWLPMLWVWVGWLWLWEPIMCEWDRPVKVWVWDVPVNVWVWGVPVKVWVWAGMFSIFRVRLSAPPFAPEVDVEVGAPRGKRPLMSGVPFVPSQSTQPEGMAETMPYHITTAP